jgi:peptidoglycan/xylan/chitin deacetylase (PgdA/CDA1 family)
MPLPDTYFDYPWRGERLDHERYRHQALFARRPVQWPGQARVALWITVHLEFFPLDMGNLPFRVLGGMERGYPDYWNYTLRDYGNRIGVYRVMRLLDRGGLRATAAFNSDVARRYPELVKAITDRRWEVMASGVNMAKLHVGGMPADAEKALVAESVSTLRRIAGAPVQGWHSPAHSESDATLDLVAAEGIAYVADWINDDMPYPVATSGGTIHAMPLTHEWSDRTLLWQYHQSSDDFTKQVVEAFRVLYDEAGQHGGRILSIALHPWIIGQPHRIRALDTALSRIQAHKGVWNATGMEILQAWRQQQA